MKKTLSLLLAALMLIGVFAPTIPIAAVAQTAADPFEGYSEWDGVTFDTSPFEGITADNGGADVTGDPVIIDTAAKLAGLAKIVNEKAVKGSYGAYKNLPIYITKNINLNGHEFPSIGKDYSVAMFAGHLEGRLDGVEGKAVTIANAYVPGPSANNTGFIGNLRHGAVKNLTLVNAVVGNKNNAGGVGIIVGYASKNVELSGLTVIDSTLIVSKNGGTVSHGGVIGTIKSDNALNLKDIKAINVTLECPGTMQSIAGGVIGWLQGQSSKPDVVYALENCYFSGTFANATQNLDADGLIMDVYLGGIVGDIQTAAKVSMKNCQFNGEIVSNLASADRIGQFGAFVANIGAGGQLTLENCVNTGKISPNKDGNVAAIGSVGAVALDLTVTNCYSVAENTATIGVNECTTLTDIPTVNVVTAEAITGDAAKTAFAGFDFTNAWKANEGALPCLKTVEDEDWTDLSTIGVVVDPPVVNPPAGGGTQETTTTKKEDTTTKAPDTTTKKDDEPAAKKGCFGVISSTAMVALLTLGLGAAVIRKKED